MEVSGYGIFYNKYIILWLVIDKGRMKINEIKVWS